MRKRQLAVPAVGAAILLLSLSSAGCGKAKKPIVVGSMNGTEPALVGEVIARYLEHHLPQHKVQRRLGIGGELITYQALETGDISLYVDYTGDVDSIILKETASADPAILLQRTRGEMQRIAQIVVMDPLGYDNPAVVVVRSSDAEQAKIHTLSEAAAGSTRWKVGVSFEFQQPGGPMPALTSYKIPMAQSLRGVEATQLFPMLMDGDLTMIATKTTNGNLTSPDFLVLEDDNHAFHPNQACLLVRQDAIMNDPDVRAALSALSGRFSTGLVRDMDAEVDLKHRSPGDVAAEFLTKAGLQ